MASPFSSFRKRQKTMMAILGVLCMFVFVFGSTQCAGPGEGPVGNAVVASTKYGDLHESELYEMRTTAATVDRFLMALVGRTTQAIIQEQKSLEQFQQQLAMNMYNSLRNQGLIMGADDNQISEVELVDLMLLEQRAKQNGVIVSDDAINDFLKQITQDNLTRDDLVSITNEMKISPKRLFDGLRTRLMAQRMRQMFALGLMNAPPAEKWDYYLRLNRRARAEIVPVKVSDVVDEVKTPDDATVSKFFQEHKDQVRQPGSPEPGFKQPHQVALQYLKAEYDKFLDEDAITAEEIEAHYEKFKDTRYLFTDPPETPADEADTGTPPADATPPAKTEAEKTEAPKTGEAPKGDAPASEAPKSGDAKPDESKAKEDDAKPSDADEKPAPEAEKPTEAKPADDAEQKPASESTTPSAEDASAQSDESTCDVGETQPAAEKSDAAQAAEAPAADGDAKAADVKADAAESADRASQATAAADSKAAAEPKEASLLELTSQLSLPQNIRDGGRPKHNPLWRVEKDIRRELAGQKAAEKMQAALRAAKPELDAYYDTFNAWKADHPDLKGDAEHPRPALPDFAALAEKHGLTAHETGLHSLYEVATETDVGQALAQVGQGSQNPGFLHAVLAASPLFRAATVEDQAGNQYLYWKVKNVEEHVPELDDEGIRQQVVDVWKEIQARELAEKKAKELAKQASDGKALSEVVASAQGLELIETQPFTWMTAGSPFLGPSAPQMTSVPGVDSPGDDFMSTVFSLEEGEAAVAFNEPKSVAYVIRVTSLEPSINVLRETFAVESPRQNQNYFMLAQTDNLQASRKWIEDVREDAGLHWNREADQVAMRD